MIQKFNLGNILKNLAHDDFKRNRVVGEVFCHWNVTERGVWRVESTQQDICVGQNLKQIFSRQCFAVGSIIYLKFPFIYNLYPSLQMLQSPLLLSAFKGHHRPCQKSEACLPGLLNELIGWCEDKSTTAINPNSLGSSPLLPDFTTELLNNPCT